MGLAHLSKTARPAWTRRQAGPFSHLIPLLIAIALSAPALADPPPRMIAAAFNEDETGSGQVVGIRAVSPWDQLKGPLPVGADATLRSAFGRVYAVSKSEDSVTVIDVARPGVSSRSSIRASEASPSISPWSMRIPPM